LRVLGNTSSADTSSALWPPARAGPHECAASLPLPGSQAAKPHVYAYQFSCQDSSISPSRLSVKAVIWSPPATGARTGARGARCKQGSTHQDHFQSALLIPGPVPPRFHNRAPSSSVTRGERSFQSHERIGAGAAAQAPLCAHARPRARVPRPALRAQRATGRSVSQENQLKAPCSRF
jgi:hypothetical protein